MITMNHDHKINNLIENIMMKSLVPLLNNVYVQYGDIVNRKELPFYSFFTNRFSLVKLIKCFCKSLTEILLEKNISCPDSARNESVL